MPESLVRVQTAAPRPHMQDEGRFKHEAHSGGQVTAIIVESNSGEGAKFAWNGLPQLPFMPFLCPQSVSTRIRAPMQLRRWMLVRIRSRSSEKRCFERRRTTPSETKHSARQTQARKEQQSESSRSRFSPSWKNHGAMATAKSENLMPELFGSLDTSRIIS